MFWDSGLKDSLQQTKSNIEVFSEKYSCQVSRKDSDAFVLFFFFSTTLSLSDIRGKDKYKYMLDPNRSLETKLVPEIKPRLLISS